MGYTYTRPQKIVKCTDEIQSIYNLLQEVSKGQLTSEQIQGLEASDPTPEPGLVNEFFVYDLG